MTIKLYRYACIVVLISLLNLVFGCTRIGVTTIHNARKSGKRIYSVGLRSSCSRSISLGEIDLIYVTRIRPDESMSYLDTIPSGNFTKETSGWLSMKIEGVVLKSGERMDLSERKSYYDIQSKQIKIDGDEVIFDKSGATLYPDSKLIIGRTIDGDSLSINVDDVVYLRQRKTDILKTSLLIVTIP